jgi:hypothetical protein
MRDTRTDTPLLLVHRRKLIVGSAVLAASALLGLLPDTLSGWIGISSWLLELAAAIVFFVLLYWLAYGLRCPGCGINLFWYGLGRAGSGNWLEWMLRQSTCPKCGYRAGGGSGGTA